jgi:hypothetical protein
MSLDWDQVVAHALSFAGAMLSTSYGHPAVKAVNGRPFVATGREPGSFCLMVDLDRVEMLKETDPDTYWQTLHYEGWPAVLVRYDSRDPDRVRAMIAAAHEWTVARPKARARKSRG